MLALPLMLPLCLDRLVESAIDDFHRVFPLRRGTSLRTAPRRESDGAWVRVRLVLSEGDALVGLHLTPPGDGDPDDDLELDLWLAFGASRREKVAILKDDLVLHWMSRALRHRIRNEGREFAHLAQDEIKALLERMCPGAQSAERYTWRFDEWTTQEAALLECECRAEESKPDRHSAIGDAAPLRERQAMERRGAEAWWSGLAKVDREHFFAYLPQSLAREERIVVAHRCYARQVRAELGEQRPAA